MRTFRWMLPGHPSRGSVASIALLILLVLAALPVASESGKHDEPRHDRSRQYVDVTGEPLPFVDDAQILRFLQTAPVVEERPVGIGINRITRLTLQQGGVRADAAFRTVELSQRRHRLPNGRMALVAKDSYRFDVAAYRISRLIGLDRIPPATLRRHDGEDGSIQLWIGNVIDERDRLASEQVPPLVWWSRQAALRRLFDNLIANYDRNQTNILLDPETWDVWLIDHGRAFLNDRKLLAPDQITRCDRVLYDRLRGLDQRTLEAELDGLLSRFELRALLQRRDAIVELIEQKIAATGEEQVLF